MSRKPINVEQVVKNERTGAGGSKKPRISGVRKGDSLGFWLAVGVTAMALGLRLAAALPISSNAMLMHPVLEDAAYQVRTLETIRDAQPSTDLPRGSLLYPRLASLSPGLLTEGSRALARSQSVLEALTALILFLWIRRRWGNWAGFGAGALYALDPIGASFAARFSPVVPASFLFVLSMWLWDIESLKGTRAWPASIAFAVTATLGFFLMPLPFVFLILLRVYKGIMNRRRKSADARVMPLTALLVAPAVLALAIGITMNRNATLPRGGPVLGWGGGLSLSRAYDPSTGGTQRRLMPPSWETQPEIEERAWEELRREGTTYDLYRFYAALGSRQAVENPAATAGVILSKTAGTIGAFPIPDELSPSFLTRREVPHFGYLDYSFAVLLALAAAGFARRRGDRLSRLLGLGLLAAGLGSVLGPASAAARQPALPLLAALAGAWIAGNETLPRFNPRVVAAGVAVLLLSLIAGFLSPTSKLRDSSEDLRLNALPFVQTMAWRQAVPLLEEAVSGNANNPDARVDLALAYRMDALHSAAEEQLEAAHAIDSTHVRTLFELARLKRDRNEIVAATSLYQELLRLRPNNAVYLNEYGRLLHLMGRMSDAETVFSRAVTLRPHWAPAQRNLQQVMSQRMQVEEALFPEELRTKADDDYRRIAPIITQAMHEENWALADSLLTWAETERGEMAMTHWLRAAYHARRGDLDASIRELEICAEIAPGRPAVVGQLTNLYMRTGRRHKIEPALKAAIESAGADSSRILAFEQIRRAAAASMEPSPSGN